MTVSTVEAAVAAKELRRWMAWLGGSLVAASFFTALALAGVSPWMILPAILVGPGLGGIALDLARAVERHEQHRSRARGARRRRDGARRLASAPNSGEKEKGPVRDRPFCSLPRL